MKSIRVKITAAIVLCSLVTSLFISILSISNAGNLSNTLAEDELVLNCENSGNNINALISRIEQSVDTLTDVSMEQMVFSNFKNNNEYVDEYTQGIMMNFYKFAEHTDGAITAYIRYNPEFTEPTSGIFLTRNDLDSNFDSVTPTDFSMYDADDLAHVGWYYIPVANKAPIWMDPYLNENINVYMISYVVPLYQGSTSVGIIGMDIDFRQITDLVDEAVAFETGHSFVVNAEGKVLYHNEIPTGTDLAEYNDGELSTVKDFMLDAQNQGKTMEYEYNGEMKSLTFVELDNGMKLALTVPVKEIKANANTLSLQIVTFLVVSIILVLVLGIVIGGNMAKPIKKITQIIKKTSELDFKEAEDMDHLAKKKDEIGVMANAVREMRSSLRDVITEMEQVKDTLVVNMDQLEEVMKENNAISEDNSATTQELVAGMQETTANTTMIVGNIGAIQDNVSAIQKLSEKEQQESLDIMTRARMLKDNTVKSNNVAMNIYATMKERTEEAIEKSQVVEKINELIEDIRNISSQTDLLALNASIEAARAGEAGKGFAIVATEIGALANQTVQSVDSITAFVGDINGAVNNMTECIQVIMKFLDETVVSDYASFNQVGEKYEKDAESFVEALQHISEEISDLNHKITDIAGAIDNVNATITQSTYGVNTIAQKSTEAVEKTIEGYESLNESGNNLNVLKELIERFEV